MLVTGIVVAVAGITIASIKAVGPEGGPTIGAVMSFAGLFLLSQLQRRRRVSVELTHGERLVFTRADAARIALRRHGSSWVLRVGTPTGDRLLHEADALAVLARVIPLFRRAATRTIVANAVRLLRASPNASHFIQAIATKAQMSEVSTSRLFTDSQSIWASTDEELVALEILATENCERASLREEVSAIRGELQDALLITDIIERELS